MYTAEASADAAAQESNTASDAASTAATGNGPPHYRFITGEELLTDASGPADPKAGGIPPKDTALVALRRNMSDVDAARMELDLGRLQVRHSCDESIVSFSPCRTLHACMSLRKSAPSLHDIGR